MKISLIRSHAMKPYAKMNRDNTALIVIDIVNSCCHADCESKELGITYLKIRDMVPKLKDFIGDYRDKVGGKIIFTNIAPWTKDYLPENIQELYKDPATTYYGDGSEFSDWYISKINTGLDHVHILIEIPPKYVQSHMWYKP